MRFSALDFVPFTEGPDDRTQPAAFDGDRYPYAFGGDGSGTGTDLREPLAFLDLLADLGIELVCVSAGAEYNSHLMEPYNSLPVAPRKPPEDPLVGVARLVSLVADLKRERPGLIYVGSGYSYLQQWLPNVAQAVVREGWADSVGIGRMSFSYPDMCADVLEGRPLAAEAHLHDVRLLRRRAGVPGRLGLLLAGRLLPRSTRVQDPQAAHQGSVGRRHEADH